MADERCEDCAFCADLQMITEYQTSLCCVAFPVIYNDGYVVEVLSKDRCELFKRRADNER